MRFLTRDEFIAECEHSANWSNILRLQHFEQENQMTISLIATVQNIELRHGYNPTSYGELMHINAWMKEHIPGRFVYFHHVDGVMILFKDDEAPLLLKLSLETP